MKKIKISEKNLDRFLKTLTFIEPDITREQLQKAEFTFNSRFVYFNDIYDSYVTKDLGCFKKRIINKHDFKNKQLNTKVILKYNNGNIDAILNSKDIPEELKVSDLVFLVINKNNYFFSFGYAGPNNNLIGREDLNNKEISMQRVFSTNLINFITIDYFNSTTTEEFPDIPF